MHPHDNDSSSTIYKHRLSPLISFITPSPLSFSYPSPLYRFTIHTYSTPDHIPPSRICTTSPPILLPRSNTIPIHAQIIPNSFFFISLPPPSYPFYPYFHPSPPNPPLFPTSYPCVQHWIRCITIDSTSPIPHFLPIHTLYTSITPIYPLPLIMTCHFHTPFTPP